MGAFPLAVGLADPVHDAQAAFRDALRALSRPGEVVVCATPAPPVALMPATAALLLALTDHETPVWWQRDGTGLAAWLRFHTGAPPTADIRQALFAVLADAAAVPALDTFAAGSDEAPDTSVTLLVEVPSLAEGSLAEWSGPGILGTRPVRIAGLNDGFWAEWADNHARFPQGVDVLFVCGTQLIGLPRTTRVRCLEGR
jgi:alpha-D-ribose 1-methylphosphonate 5-triphosphate synthase subunit PhnH